jgi:hypothetical protein
VIAGGLEGTRQVITSLVDPKYTDTGARKECRIPVYAPLGHPDVFASGLGSNLLPLNLKRRDANSRSRCRLGRHWIGAYFFLAFRVDSNSYF